MEGEFIWNWRWTYMKWRNKKWNVSWSEMKGELNGNESWVDLKIKVSLSEQQIELFFLSEMKGELIWIGKWAYLQWKVSLSEDEGELVWNERWVIWNERKAYLKWKVSLSETTGKPIWNEMWSYFPFWNKRWVNLKWNVILWTVSLFRTQSEPIWNERQAYLKRKVSLSEMKCETLRGRWVALNLLVKRILLREFFPLIFTKSEYTKLYMIRKKFVAVFYVNIYYRIMLLD